MKTRETQKKTVIVRGMEIGAGVPKICVPMTGVTVEEVCAEAKALTAAGADLAEWRMDWFSGFDDPESVTAALNELRNCLGKTPLLATFRTKQEGGNAEISPEIYSQLYETVLNSGQADLIDLELFFDEATVTNLMTKAKERDVKTVLSSHDFAKTPEAAELTERLARMEALDCDIAKVAVMPQSAEDVAALLLATAQSKEALSCPVVTMSMGGQGVISRMAGEVFGSAITFGTVGKASAPGQMALEELKKSLQLIHSAVEGPAKE